MANAWMTHVAGFRKQNSHMSLKQLLKEARKSYKSKSGGRAMASHSSLPRAPPAQPSNNKLRGGADPVGWSSSKGVAAHSSKVGGRRSRRKTRRSRR